jgi:hypothetical protein
MARVYTSGIFDTAKLYKDLVYGKKKDLRDSHLPSKMLIILKFYCLGYCLPESGLEVL